MAEAPCRNERRSDTEQRAQNAAAIRESKMNRRNSFYSYYYVYKSFASFANASSFALSAPHISFTITPLEYSWNVGIALIPQAAATSSNSSTSTLTNSTSGNLVASSSKYGPIALHGPHHVAVKSTRSCCFWRRRRRFQREREILLLQRSSSKIPPLGKNPISKMDDLEERVCILSQRPKTTQPGVVVFEAKKRTKRERVSYRFARFLQRVKLVRGFYVFHHVSVSRVLSAFLLGKKHTKLIGKKKKRFSFTAATRVTLDRRRFKIIIIIIMKKTLYLSLSLARVSVLAPQFFSLYIYIYTIRSFAFAFVRSFRERRGEEEKRRKRR